MPVVLQSPSLYQADLEALKDGVRDREVVKGNKVTLARSEPCLLRIRVLASMKQCY